MRATQALCLAALAWGCGTAPRTKDEPPAMTTVTSTTREAPWTISYGDGSANVYRFSQASPGGEIASSTSR